MGRPPIGQSAMSAAERQRRRRAKLSDDGVAKPSAPSLQDEIAALRAELASERERRSQAEAAMLAQAQRDKAAAKSTKPALPPDEVRERRIKALTTENTNLKRQIRATVAEFDRRRKNLDMDRGLLNSTFRALSKCLHPDQRNNATDADKDQAFRLLTEWRSDNKARGIRYA